MNIKIKNKSQEFIENKAKEITQYKRGRKKKA